MILSAVLLCLSAKGQNLPPIISGETVVIEETVNTDITTNYLIIKSLTLLPKSETEPLVITATASNEWYAKIIETSDNIPPSMGENFVRSEVARVAVTDENDFSALDLTKRVTSFGYTDGLGRGKQSIAAAITPGGQDMIGHVKYNTTNGKMENGYLPYANAQTNPGAYRSASATEQSAFYAGSNPLIPNDTKPYSFTDTEDSPLGRVKEQVAVGAAYHDNNKKNTFTYAIHDGATGAEQVRKWIISGGVPYAPNTSTYRYAANKVFISEVVSAEGIRAQTIVDSKGQKVASRIRNGSTWLTTYYVYDDFGQLRFIVPPMLDEDYSLTTTEVDNLCFQYTYDERHRLIGSKKPGAGWDYIVYDKWDRPVLSQNAMQRATNDWTFYKYDQHNRLIMSGRYSSASSQATLQTSAMAATNRYESTSSSAYGYTTNATFPTTVNEVYAIQYYDDYDYRSRIGINTTTYNFNNPSGFSNTQGSSLKGLVTGSKIKILGTSNYLHTVIYYDQKYRMVQAVADNHLGGTDRVTIDMEWSGQVNKTQRDHTGAESVTVVNTYDYDDHGRLLNEWQQIDSQTNTMVASYRYNELGQVIEKNLHSTDGNSFLQSIDYRFDIRGALTSINNPNLNNDGTLNDDSGDLFGAKFHYTNAHTINGRSIPGRYDGNITAFEWQNKNNEAEPGFKKSIYGYEYDDLNRLSRAEYATDNSGNWTGDGGDYTVNYAYDDHGNMTDIDRKGQGETIDDLNFTYPTKSNQLSGVADASNDAEGFDDEKYLITDYEYDQAGNLITDLNKEINIEYNHLNLVTRMRFSDGTEFTFQYDATGNRLNKTLIDADDNVVAKVDYVGGVEYLNDEIRQLMFSQGRAYTQQGDYHYEYFMTDHLGNTRVTFGNLPERNIYFTDMEAGASDSQFSIPSATVLKDTSFNHTPMGNTCNYLDGTAVKAVGAAKVIEISPGDEVSMEFWAKYHSAGSGNQTNGFMTAVLNALSSAGTVVMGESLVNTAGNNLDASLFTTGKSSNSGAWLYLNYVFINTDGTVDAGLSNFIAVTSMAAGQYTKFGTTAPLTFNKAGYLYVFLANEKDNGYNVHFDDLKITHESPNSSFKVSQVNDYYPYGMRMATSWDRDAETANNRQYNGGSEYNSTTGLYETFYRMYDPTLGRFQGVDIAAGGFAGVSPYNFALNSPGMMNDPRGDKPVRTDTNIGGNWWIGNDGNYFSTTHGVSSFVGWWGDSGQAMSIDMVSEQSTWGLVAWNESKFQQVKRRGEFNAAWWKSMIGQLSSYSSGGFYHYLTPGTMGFGSSATALTFGMNYNNRFNSWGQTEYGMFGQDQLLLAARIELNPVLDLKTAMAYQDPQTSEGDNTYNGRTDWGIMPEGVDGMSYAGNVRFIDMNPKVNSNDGKMGVSKNSVVKYAETHGWAKDFYDFVKPEHKVTNGLMYGFFGAALFIETTGALLLYNNPQMMIDKKTVISLGAGTVFSFGAGFGIGYTGFKPEP